MYSSIIIITYSPSTVQVTVFLKENVSARRGRDQLSCLGIEGQHLPSADYYITQGHVRSTHKSLPSKEASLPTPRPANLFHPARVSWCGDASNPTCQEGRSSSRSDSQLSLLSRKQGGSSWFNHPKSYKKTSDVFSAAASNFTSNRETKPPTNSGKLGEAEHRRRRLGAHSLDWLFVSKLNAAITKPSQKKG